MTNVVLIRSNPVSPDPPVEKAANTLISNGYNVTIVGWDRDSSIVEKTEEMSFENGTARIIRFGIPAIFGGGIKKNFAPLVKFQNRLYKWLKKHRDEYDIIHSFDFDTGFVAGKIAKKYNKPLIYHILDFYIDSHNIPGEYLKAKVKNAEISVINNADATIICTDKRREQIAGSSPKRLEIIHNTPKVSGNISDRFVKTGISDRCKIVYVGILAGSRFLREIIRFVEHDERFEFHIGGFGVMEDEIADAANKCERIFFYGKLPYADTLSLEKSCDVMVAIYDPKVPNHKFSAPNKFYESLMLGKPIVMAKGTGFDEIINDNNIGCLIDFSEDGLSAGLNKLIDQRDKFCSMAERMKQLYKENYSWAEMEKRLASLYTGVVLNNEKNTDCK